MSTLTSSERLRGRRFYALFQGLNTVSYLLVAGNIVTLYALRLGATSAFVGLIAALPYIGLMFMFVGRRLSERYGIKRIMIGGWGLRYIVVLPLLVSPFIAATGNLVTALTLVFLGLLGFHTSRGVGVIGFNPVMGVVSEGPDRGAYITRLQVINQAASIGGGLLIAIVLGARPPLSRYTVLILTGLITGLAATSIIFRMPDPEVPAHGLGRGLVDGIATAIKRPTFRKFVILFTAMSAIFGMANPFTVVFAKRVYEQTDNLVIIYSVLGNLGGIVMGLLSGLLIDRLGAKPLYVFFTAFLAVGIVPFAVAPTLLPGIAPIVFLGVMFFVFQLGLVGATNAAQNYFFAIITSSEFLNLGILYNLCNGFGGAIGSLVGGLLLDLAPSLGLHLGAPSFRAYYGFSFFLVLLVLVFVARLSTVGRYTLRNAFNIIFSPRDLRAVALLNRLGRSRTIDEEVAAIRALGESRSEVPVEDLLQRLKHPRFYVRQQALQALEVLPVDHQVTSSLINEVKNHKFTTAYIAARIIGRRGIRQGIKALRASVDSADYLLQANAMLALGRLGDVDSVPLIEHAMTRSRNPLVLIHAATALEALGSTASIPLLMELLKTRNAPPFLRDEMILSIAGIIGFGEWFYGHYAKFLEKARSGMESLSDFLAEKYNDGCGVDKGSIAETLRIAFHDEAEFSRQSAVHLAKLSSDAFGLGSLVSFVEATTDPELIRFERFRFLIAALLVWGACYRVRGSEMSARVD